MGGFGCVAGIVLQRKQEKNRRENAFMWLSREGV